jgi:hypothetical protein
VSDNLPRDASGVGAAFLAGLPVTGAAFSLMTSDAVRDTVYASDATIDALARLQYQLGEGPTLTAFTTHRPVLLADLHAGGHADRWPIFAREVAGLPIGGLFAFPMQLGAITIGVCETYRATPGPLGRDELIRVLRAVDVATVSLLAVRAQDIVVDLGTGDAGYPQDEAWLDGHAGGRAVVHQATGMLTVQLGVGLVEAFSRLRAHAYAAGRDMDEVAREIVEHRLRLDTDPK